MLPSRAFFLSLTVGLALLAGPVAAQDAPDTPAKATTAAKESDAANAKASPAKAVPGAKKDETNKTGTPSAPAAPSMSKEDATAAADAITAYDPDKVVGEAKPWQLGFQEAVTPVMQKIRGLHDHFVLYIITVIAVFVLCLLGYVCVRFRASANPTPRNFSHNTLIEVIWTAVPIIVLVAIGVPSLRVHFAYDYNQNIISHPDLTLKVVGHQWYWSYEYPDQGFGYDSNVTQDKDLKNGAPRLLTVDNPLVVPVGKVVKVQVTGADVIHDWSVPAFGIKQDAVPGRLNEVWFKAEKEGIYYGQCDQLCGKFHGFMPIEIHVVAPEVFAEWADAAKVKYASNGNVEFAALQQRK